MRPSLTLAETGGTWPQRLGGYRKTPSRSLTSLINPGNSGKTALPRVSIVPCPPQNCRAGEGIGEHEVHAVVNPIAAATDKNAAVSGR